MSWKQKAYEKALGGKWTQLEAEGCPGSMCAGGMIAWAITGDPLRMYNSHDLRVDSALKEFLLVNEIDRDPEVTLDRAVAVWNDHPHRTLRDVQEAFRKLVEAEENQK